MECRITISRESKAALAQLDIHVRRAIKKSIKKLGQNPLVGKGLTEKLEGFFSLRVGKYRVIYTIGQGTVDIVTVGHRRDIYTQLRTRRQSMN